MIALRIAVGVRAHFIHRLPEWLLSAQLGMFGWQLSRTGDTFTTSSTYLVMAHLATETVWSGVALGLSLFWLVSLILNGTFSGFARCSKWVRSISAFLGAGFWTVTAVSMFEANPISTGVTGNAGFAIMAFVVSLVTAREVGAADRRARDAGSRN